MQYRIRSRLIISIIAYLLIVIIVASVMIYHFYASQIKSRSQQLLEKTAEDVAIQIDAIFEEMDTLSTQLLSSETLQRIILNASEDSSAENYFDRNITELRTAQDILWAFNSPKSRIENISIFNEVDYLGLRYSPSAAQVRNVAELYLSESFSSQEFYRILPVHTSYWDTINKKPVVSLYRPYIASDFGFQVLGVIEIEEKYERIQRICDQASSSTHGEVLLIDDSGTVLHPLEYGSLDKELITRIGGAEVSVRINQESYRISTAQLEWAPWQVVLLQPQTYYMDPLNRFIRDLLGVISLLTLIIFVVIIFIVNTVTRPFSRLVETIDTFSLDKEVVGLQDSQIKEVRIIQSAFVRLIERLRESVDRLMLAQKTELNLRIMNLQAKINPHFLFNSLSAIGSIGMEEGSPTVPIMCAQLSNLFRYTSGSEEQESTTLQDEVENITLYMEFMKWRLEDALQFSVTTEGDLSTIHLPKLILQPLVENCFTHGFKRSLPPYHIKVDASVCEESWTLRISDNGGGFETKALDQLIKQLEFIDAIFEGGKDYQKLKSDDKAILNIYIRLRLQYAQQISLHLENALQGGARIMIRVDSPVGAAAEEREERKR